MKANKWAITVTVLISIITVLYISFIVRNWHTTDLHVEDYFVDDSTGNYAELDLQSIIHHAQKAVVQIEATNEFTTKNGSGFLYNHNGDIITNAHVIKDADYITVKFANARQYPAAVVGIGDNTDIALIRVPDIGDVEPLEISLEENIDIGKEVIAVGSPLGIQNAVSLGLIVGTDRSFSVNDYQYENVYQISANITHGNSGGPLISRTEGNVVGINAAGISDTDIGFSIPLTNDIRERIDQWIEKSKGKQLVYASPTDQNLQTKSLEEDADYIAEYFFESISIRDYINAYTLLGSSLQSELSYAEFRDTFTKIVELTIQDVNLQNEKEQEISAKVSLLATSRSQSHHEVDNDWVYKLTIGYENDQVKILDFTLLNS
ncbi:S1C family serine protease [Gracilibacillus sp. YIM 98692]|uniref:S1C family serine protease n=1 Tax=Gracilibacillus sp. YIM 98692 TaxID=2663532 RepID=UPI0013D26A33|nr:S1C family serine protease [Gracilibacillus sp. YIM 98692]